MMKIFPKFCHSGSCQSPCCQDPKTGPFSLSVSTRHAVPSPQASLACPLSPQEQWTHQKELKALNLKGPLAWQHRAIMHLEIARPKTVFLDGPPARKAHAFIAAARIITFRSVQQLRNVKSAGEKGMRRNLAAERKGIIKSLRGKRTTSSQ